MDKFSLACNKIAMDYLGINDFDMSFKLLKSTEKLLNLDGLHEQNQLSEAIQMIPIETRRRLLSLTFNNLGCYYKK